MPLAPSLPKVCLGIMVVVTSVFKALFLVDKTDATRLSNDAPNSGALTYKSSIGAFPLFRWLFLEEIGSSSISHLEEFVFMLFSKRDTFVLRSFIVTYTTNPYALKTHTKVM